MKETLIIAIILGAFALLASLRAARLDAANAAKPRRNGRTGGKESAGKGAEQGRLRPTILRTAAVGMAVLAIGITPDTALAKEAGLELGIKGSIVVNDRMETSVPDIYAAGDAVQVKHYVTGEDALISLAGPANKQGRIIADNICGGDSRYLGSQGSSVIKVFDITAATTGINETNAKKAGLDVDKVILSPMSHAGYYPGGKLMTMKVVFEKGTCRLLGAQIVGYEGVDKRIDVLAAAIHAGMRATQLKNLDLAYAPPYSSAKDPVNIAGFMIDNIANGTMKQWYLEDVDHLPRDGSAILLDVRTPDEYAGGHMEGFGNIPLDDLRDRLDEIEPGKPVYVTCQSGLRSYIACRILEADPAVRQCRMALCLAVRSVIRNVLTMFKVTVPESM